MATRISIRDARMHLSRYIERVERGETFVLCKRNVPVAEIRPITKPTTGPRPIGLAKGTFEIADAFFDPLPNELLSLYEGEGCAPDTEIE